MRDFWDYAEPIIIVIVVMAIVIGGALIGVNAWSQKGCNNYTAMNPDYLFRYDFWAGGCFVKYGDLWISTENIQLLNGEISIGK